MKSFHLHLISDSTGETVGLVARASLVQFDDIVATEHIWNMIRNESQIDEVLDKVRDNPGMVLYTLVSHKLREMLENGCKELQVPCISILDPIVAAIGYHVGAEVHASPGRRHVMDAEYFARIEAMHFVLNHDDGQSISELDQADVVLLGVSRTSKTPTCIYLANRGIKAANIPIVPGSPLPQELMETNRPLIVGLIHDAKQLVQIRRNRLRMLNQNEETDYIDPETVTREVNESRKLFTKHGWPVIDSTRKSIEEVAATVIKIYNRRLEETL
ncbi:MAG: kinase/pyrophosphorylase [Rhodospirillales bacterium]|nr:kinase/pyrophosphorylase [Rhodospirillales bacterium]